MTFYTYHTLFHALHLLCVWHTCFTVYSILLVYIIDLIGFITLSTQFSKTTWPISMKLTHVTEGVVQSLFTNFQEILYFGENIKKLRFKGHRFLLWSCRNMNKLKLF